MRQFSGAAAPALEPGDMHVWWFALDDMADAAPELEPTLSIDERERAGRFRAEGDRRRFVVARGVLRALLGRYLASPAAELRFRYGSYGKPELITTAGSADIRFNLAHAGEVAVYALTHGRDVGVDVERVRPFRDLELVAERFFTRSEWRAVRALPQGSRDVGFFTCWTMKEAVLKAVGSGLTQPLDSFAVTFRTDAPPAIDAVAPSARSLERLKLERLAVGEGYVGAVCVEPPLRFVRYYRVGSD